MKSSETVAQVHDLSAAEKVKLCREALFSGAGPREVITRIAEIVAPDRKDPWGFD